MKKGLSDSTKKLFFILLGVFLLLIAYFATPFPLELKRALFPIAAILGFAFFILGGALMFFAGKSGLPKVQKVFFILTGASAVSFLVFAILHNLVYGLMIYLFGEGFWNGGDEFIFFLLAFIGSPLGFLTGAIGSIVLLIKGKK